VALGDRSGAIVVMDPRNGEILALVSHPSYDPNAFAVRIGRADWNRLITDPNRPLMNKAIQAQLAPGSTFKILMSVAGLEEGIAQNMHVNCGGGANFYGHFYHCDKNHGSVDIHNAIPMSCDTFYYTLADRLGIDRISQYASRFGYGQKTGVDLPGEQPGLMPSAQWLMKNYHRKWYAGETISVGIGQGAVEATPLQLARVIGGIASGGKMVRPHTVFPDQLPEGFRKSLKDSFPGTGEADFPIDPQSWMTITDGMAEVTQPGAFHTASSAHLEGIDFAGKTGTAQVVGHEALSHMAKTNDTIPNVWFVGVTPRRNPELVIATLWQHGGFSYYPARIAAQVVAAYVEKKRRQEGNLQAAKVVKPTEMGAVWTDGDAEPGGGKKAGEPGRLHAARFLVGSSRVVASGVLVGRETDRAKADPKKADQERSAEPAFLAAKPVQVGADLPGSSGKGR
jgi:penicillin-binding protein 2